MAMTCGEATIRLLAKYGITKVFGIPGVHTLGAEACLVERIVEKYLTCRLEMSKVLGLWLKAGLEQLEMLE